MTEAGIKSRQVRYVFSSLAWIASPRRCAWEAEGEPFQSKIDLAVEKGRWSLFPTARAVTAS